jgi:hypothetical protein
MRALIDDEFRAGPRRRLQRTFGFGDAMLA